MFKRKPKPQSPTTPTPSGASRKLNWLKVSLVANTVILIVVAVWVAGAAVVHQSDTNPSFCATCHIMESHVTSYLTGDNLDHKHAEAGVLCKDCHDYPLSEEIRAGIDFLTTNYELDENGELSQRDFGDEICTQCHVSMEHVALKTDFLYYNPHDSGMGIFTCNTCHLSHSEQIDYCSECHTNGGQRMLGDTTPRAEQLGEDMPANSGTGFNW